MLRLHHDGVSAREIGRTLGVARSTIQDNLRRAQAIGIAWPVPAELTDDILEQRLFARTGSKDSRFHLGGDRRPPQPFALTPGLRKAGADLFLNDRACTVRLSQLVARRTGQKLPEA